MSRSPYIKVVDFSATIYPHIYKLAFGDLLPGGGIDDTVVSNNGDIIRVLSTVLQIIRDFTSSQPYLKIMFQGSTKERTILYGRILRMYYREFSAEFKITALVFQSGRVKEVPFNPNKGQQFLAFYIKRF